MKEFRTNSELNVDKYDLEYRIANLQSEIDDCNKELREINAELRRRQIEAYWQKNKGMRLEVGDKLLVTEECNATFEYKKSRNRWIPGLVVTVEIIIPENGVVRFQHESIDETIGTSIPIARRMRQAWLDKYGDKSKTG